MPPLPRYNMRSWQIASCLDSTDLCTESRRLQNRESLVAYLWCTIHFYLTLLCRKWSIKSSKKEDQVMRQESWYNCTSWIICELLMNRKLQWPFAFTLLATRYALPMSGCVDEMIRRAQLIIKHEAKIHPHFSRSTQQTTVSSGRRILLMTSSSFRLITLLPWTWLPAKASELFKLVLCVPVSWISFSPVQRRPWSLLLPVLLSIPLYFSSCCLIFNSLSLRKTKNVMNSTHCFVLLLTSNVVFLQFF